MGEECRRLVGELNSLDSMEGLVKCTVLTPRELYHPVLPYRAHNKLLFALCRGCCEELNQEECEHKETKYRTFTGTWVSNEIKRAVSVRYEVIAVHEIWQYKTIRYDKKTGLEKVACLKAISTHS